MASTQELQVQQKRELQTRQEATAPTRFFVPVTDIYENEQALTVVMEMPGVAKSNVEINVENDVLKVEGRIDFSKYETMHPIYTEYNVGHYRRSFSLSNRIDQDKIAAEMADGVMTLTLPKIEEAKPRKIAVELKREVKDGSAPRRVCKAVAHRPPSFAPNRGGFDPVAPSEEHLGLNKKIAA
jgi:HSP20 family protein